MDPLHQQKALLAALCAQRGFPHPTDSLAQVETHISTVILAGDHAYKIKKPLNLGFLDFSTLARRGRFCHDEITINRVLAPRIYLDVATINGSPESPRINGPGPILDYAVHMRRFDRERQLDNLLAAGQLPVAAMSELGAVVARFHTHAAQAPTDSDFGTATAVLAPMRANFALLRERSRATPERDAQLAALVSWTETQARQLQDYFATRIAGGFIRAVHGDMHLGNMVFTDTPDGQPEVAIFDAIEFNPQLRWIDTVSELAFLTMDLYARAAPAHARHVLSAYLDHRPDYAGLHLLPFYQVYRALVRAKVNAILGSELGQPAAAQEHCDHEVSHYLNLAERLSQKSRPFLILMHGVSGSGKTHVSTLLLEQTGAVRLRSDIARRHLAGLPIDQRPDTAAQEKLYTTQGINAVYAWLREQAAEVLAAGLPVLVDATFLLRSQRAPFQQLAQSLGIPWIIVACTAPLDHLEQRLAARQRIGRDASDADNTVLAMQLSSVEAPGPDEPVQFHDSTLETVEPILEHWLSTQGLRQTTSHSTHRASDQASSQASNLTTSQASSQASSKASSEASNPAANPLANSATHVTASGRSPSAYPSGSAEAPTTARPTSTKSR